ncbi:MAG: transglutaminase family protein [Planctomycetes bacterium]|nr:transglutaminase family protein [Planctomycetota bacterium]
MNSKLWMNATIAAGAVGLVLASGASAQSAPAAPSQPAQPTSPTTAPTTAPRVPTAPRPSTTTSPGGSPHTSHGNPAAPNTGGSAQPTNPGANQPNATAPTTPTTGQVVDPNAPMKPGAGSVEWPKVTEGPYVTRTVPKDWLLQIIIDVSSTGSVMPGVSVPSGSTPFVFDSMTMVFPIVATSSNSSVNISGVNSWLRFEGHEVMTGGFAKEWTAEKPAPVLLKTMASGQLYPSGVNLGKWYWEKPNTQTRTVQLMIEIPTTSSRVFIDDAAACKVPWPKGSWPEVAAATFQPQMFIDCGIDPITFEMKMYNMKPIQDAVREWTKGNPKEITPHKLAKYLTHKVVHGMIPGRPDILFGMQPQSILGLNLLGAPLAMETKQIGTKDMGTVLVACMREAGLPARLIYGYQALQVVPDGSSQVQFSNNDRFRCWVEYCLYDEEKKTINWIPIDYQQFRFTSNAMGNLDMPWNYIGTLPYAESMVPVALQAFPPTTVMGYGYPALWGWVLMPGVPVNVGQQVTVSTSRAGTSPKNQRGNQGQSNNPPNQVR